MLRNGLPFITPVQQKLGCYNTKDDEKTITLEVVDAICCAYRRRNSGNSFGS